MADLTQAYDALKKADAAGNSADAKRLADYIRSNGSPAKTKTSHDISEGTRTAGDLVGAAVEPMMSMASSGLLQIPAGLAGLGAGATNALGITNTPPADVVNAVQGAAYQPKTAGGQNALKAFGAIPQAVEESISREVPGVAPLAGRQRFGGSGTKPSGEWSPAAKTVGETLLKAAPRLAGMKGGAALAETPGVLKPRQVPQTIRDLAAQGVVTTPGMRGGKIASALEQRATSIPLVGDVIKRARGKTTEQWNRAELNEAIKDAGGTAIPANRTGRDAIFHAEQEMGKAYDSVLSKMSGDINSADQSGAIFRTFLDQTKQLSAQALEPSAAKIVTSNVDKIIGKFGKTGKITGETVKEIQETLRTEIDSLKGGSYQERKAAEALKGVSADMKAMLKRENPVLAPKLDNIDLGYSKFKASSKASLYATKNQGTYTPAQKLQAIKARDKSKDKQRTASGQAHGQKEAEAVEAVIGNTEPDSGSAGRIATMEALLGGGGIAAGHPVAAAAAAGAPLMYSQPVLKALQNRAIRRGINPPAKSTGALLGSGAALSVDQNGVGQ